MGFCGRKGVECECLSEHSVCNSDNCHRQLPDVVIKEKKLSELTELLRKATVSAEDLVSFGEDYYDISPELMATIVKAKAILKELDENKAIIEEIDNGKVSN
jgi:outer membrane protein OmpA-like peptidoglycan-associated protein